MSWRFTETGAAPQVSRRRGTQQGGDWINVVIGWRISRALIQAHALLHAQFLRANKYLATQLLLRKVAR